MSTIARATADQAERLFEIMVRATQVGCARSYPPEVLEIWHQGRTADGLREIIARSEFFALSLDGVPRGFVHHEAAQVVGLFVHPDDQGKGY